MLAHSSVTQNINKSSFPNKCKKVCSNTSSCEYFSLYIKFKLCYKMLTEPSLAQQIYIRLQRYKAKAFKL